jgi:Flp pilus assembly pilin Flp
MAIAQTTRGTMLETVRDQRGSTFVEYVIAVGLLALVAAAGVLALGVPLLRFYRFTEMVLTAPV